MGFEVSFADRRKNVDAILNQNLGRFAIRPHEPCVRVWKFDLNLWSKGQWSRKVRQGMNRMLHFPFNQTLFQGRSVFQRNIRPDVEVSRCDAMIRKSRLTS